ncbi:hypothetical protein GF376_04500 [Candidatus Peregrinibacteria bacterium]|nr:hypothetical protein [Candidatus Peregrinibacteria bacterium]
MNRLIIGKKANRVKIRSAVKQSANLKLISEKIVFDNEYFENKKRQLLIDEYWKRIKNKNWIFKYVPYIRFLCICNYLGFGVIDDDSDIDVFIVTEKNRIYTTKFFATFFTHLIGARRHGKKIRKRFCLSFFVVEDNIDLENYMIEDDIYLAYWLIGLLPIYGANRIWNDLEISNKHWINKYFDKFTTRRSHYHKSKNVRTKLTKILLENILNTKLGDILEKKLKKIFNKRFQANKKYLPENASVIVKDNILKYHNNDQRKVYRDDFFKRLKRSKLFSELFI